MKKALRKLTRLSTGQMGVAFVDAETGEILPHPLPEDYEAVGQDGSKLSEIEVAETEEAIAETEELDQDPNNTNTDSDHVTTGGNGKSPLKGATLKTPFKGLKNIFSKDDQVQEYKGKDYYPTASTSSTTPTTKTRRALDEPYYKTHKDDQGVSYEEGEPSKTGTETPAPKSSVSYNIQGKERHQKLSPGLEAKFGKALGRLSESTGLDLGFNVTSGGQVSIANQKKYRADYQSNPTSTNEGLAALRRTKNSDTSNHDFGRAGDGQFTLNGKPINPFDSKNKPLLSKLVEELASVGITNVGWGPRYQGGNFHIGDGSNQNVWAGKGEKAVDWVVDAVNKGKSRFDPNEPLYANVPIPSEKYNQAEQRNIDSFTTDTDGNPILPQEYWSNSAIEGNKPAQSGDIPQEYWSEPALAGQNESTSQKIINQAKTVNSSNLSNESVEQMIIESATARGIDPEVAVAVAKSEGLGGTVDYTTSWRSTVSKNGVQEPSYGPFQLLVGQDTQGYGAGLGDEFISKTGLDPRDPQTVQAQINFALDHSATKGWGAWYGAKNVDMPQGSGLTTARAIGWQNTTPEQRWDYSSNKVDVPIPAPTPVYETPSSNFDDNDSSYTPYASSNTYSEDNNFSIDNSNSYEDNSSLVSAYQDYGSSRVQSNESTTTGYTPSNTTSYEDNSSLVSGYQDYGDSRSVSDRGKSITDKLEAARDEINDFKNPIGDQPNSNSYEDKPSLVSAYQDYGNSRTESEEEENSKSVDSKPSGSIGDMLGSWF